MAKARKKKAAPKKKAAKKAMKKSPPKKKGKTAKKAAPRKKAATSKRAKPAAKPKKMPASKTATPVKAKAAKRRVTDKPAGPKLSDTLSRTERFTPAPRVYEPMPLPMPTDAPIRKEDRPTPWFDRPGTTIPGSDE